MLYSDPAPKRPVKGLFRPSLTAAAFALTCLMSIALPAAADTFYRLDFEGARMTGTGVQEGNKTYRLRTEGGGKPGKILRDKGKNSSILELRSAPTPDGAGKDRTEVQIYSGVTFDKDWYAGLQVFVPADVAFSDTWHLLLQCIQPVGNALRSPPISLNLTKGGKLALISRNDADNYKKLWSTPMPRGRWVNLVLHLRMGENGRARLWMDGKQVTDKTLHLGWNIGEPRCVLKTGIYRGDADTPFVVRLDNVTLGTSHPGTPPD